jgi:glycosyltransferase involved in cell wall biosynthesis
MTTSLGEFSMNRGTLLPHDASTYPQVDRDHYESLTVLICTWNRARLLGETLDSLAQVRVPDGLHWNVLVVDNNSSDETSTVVRRHAASYPVPLQYAFEPRQGKSWAMNTGLAASGSAIIAFVDDDIKVGHDWLYAIATAFQEAPGTAYVGGRVDPIWEAPCPSWFGDTGKTLWGTFAILDYGDQSFVFEERRKIPIGANFALRRSLVDRVGGFDPMLGRDSERVLLGQELPEFFVRVRAAGLQGRYLPTMSVRHHVPARRMTRQYIRRWWYGKGISRARMEAVHPVTEVGLDLRRVPKIAGIPRFLFGSAVRDVLRWSVACFRLDVGRRLAAETQLYYFAGQVRERLRQAVR